MLNASTGIGKMLDFFPRGMPRMSTSGHMINEAGPWRERGSLCSSKKKKKKEDFLTQSNRDLWLMSGNRDQGPAATKHLNHMIIATVFPDSASCLCGVLWREREIKGR